MKARAFVLVVGVGDVVDPVQIRASVQYVLDNFSGEELGRGVVEWPDGVGEHHLLPALVEKS